MVNAIHTIDILCGLIEIRREWKNKHNEYISELNSGNFDINKSINYKNELSNILSKINALGTNAEMCDVVDNFQNSIGHEIKAITGIIIFLQHKNEAEAQMLFMTSGRILSSAGEESIIADSLLEQARVQFIKNNPIDF